MHGSWQETYVACMGFKLTNEAASAKKLASCLVVAPLAGVKFLQSELRMAAVWMGQQLGQIWIRMGRVEAAPPTGRAIGLHIKLAFA